MKVGFWSAGTVAFALSEWSVSPRLLSPVLSAAPLWVVVKEVPPQLWSDDGIELIASALGDLLPDQKPRRLANGDARLKVLVNLLRPVPPVVAVQDRFGDIIRVETQVEHLPPLCTSCSKYGHQPHRCPLRNSSQPPPQTTTEQLEAKSQPPSLSSPPPSANLPSTNSRRSRSSSRLPVTSTRRRRHRSKSSRRSPPPRTNEDPALTGEPLPPSVHQAHSPSKKPSSFANGPITDPGPSQNTASVISSSQGPIAGPGPSPISNQKLLTGLFSSVAQPEPTSTLTSHLAHDQRATISPPHRPSSLVSITGAQPLHPFPLPTTVPIPTEASILGPGPEEANPNRSSHIRFPSSPISPTQTSPKAISTKPIRRDRVHYESPDDDEEYDRALLDPSSTFLSDHEDLTSSSSAIRRKHHHLCSRSSSAKPQPQSKSIKDHRRTKLSKTKNPLFIASKRLLLH